MSAAHDHEAFEERLHAYFDGELPPDEEREVLEHLADCESCQTTLDDLMGMQVALGRSAAPVVAEVSRPAAPRDGDAARIDPTRDAKIVSLDARRPRRRMLLIGGGLLAAAAAVTVVVTTRGRGGQRAPAIALADTRPVEVRFSAPDFAQHRPYRVERGSADVTPIPLATLSALEQRGDRAALAAALVWSGDRARASSVLDQMASDDPSVLADRAAVAILRGDAEAALELADAALRREPTHAAAGWNRALALRDLGLPLTAALQLETMAASDESAWGTEARERARALRQPVEATLAARLDASMRRRKAIAEGGAPLTAADVERAPTVARHYFHDAVRIAASAADLDALQPLAEALDRQSGGDECARELRRLRGLDLALRGSFAPRYRAVAAGKLSPDEVSQLLEELTRAGRVVDDVRLGVLILSGRFRTDAAAVQSILANSDNPWFQLFAVQERAVADGRRPGDVAFAERLCVNPAWSLRCAAIDYELARSIAALGRLSNAERYALRNVERLVVGSTGVEERGAFDYAGQVLRARGRLALAAAFTTEALSHASPDDCTNRRLLTSSLAEIERQRGAFVRSRSLLLAPYTCLTGVEESGVAAAVDLARDSGEDEDRRLAAEWIKAGYQAELPTDYLHAAQARLEITTEAGAREILLDVTAHPPAGDYGPAIADWAWRTIIADDGRRGDWNGVFQHTLAAVGQGNPTTCAVTLAADDAIHTVAWRDSNGTAGGAQWRTPAEWPALPASALYGCPTTAVIALSPLHGRPPPWKLGAWAWSTGREHAAAAAAATRDALVIAATTPPHELLDLPNLAPVPVPAGARGLVGADATPRRVAEAMKTATYVEIHAHGLVDLDVDDGGFVALSPDASGEWRLTASAVRGMKLAGAPVVVLAACRAAEAAPDRLRRWSLPDAFLAAGARAVIAADVAVPDDLIRAFVDDVRGRLERGEAPAQAAAAARAALVAKDPGSASWVERLMVFE